MQTFSGSSSAQVGFGVKGGVNFATVGGADAPSNAKSITGFAAGAYAENTIPFLFSIQPEVLYSTKGFTADETIDILGSPYTVKETGNLSYIDIPVLLKYTLPVPVLKPALYAGPYVGILLKAKAKGEITGFPAQEMDVKDQTTSTDFGLVFGASANVAIITVSARYGMGLTSMDKGGTGTVYNRVWSLMVELPL